MITIQLKHGKENSLERFHPWVFSGAIAKIEEPAQNGDLVRVVSSRGKFLGIGHYQNASIAVRIISFHDVPVDEAFWQNKIQAAWDTRSRIGLPNTQTNMFRWVHGEGDGLTGLVIDCYGDTVILQPHSTGMFRSANEIADALVVIGGQHIKNILLKHPSASSDEPAELLRGEIKSEYQAKEWGINYRLDLVKGQKTGFFVDQRENRRILGNYSKGKSVLNTFCYNGGFSLCALEAGAVKVVSVDASKSAILQTQANLELNGFDPVTHPCIAADTFDFLNTNHEVFDIIILDPPAFAKHMSARHNAIKGYQRLNAEAIKHIKPGGILFTFSCSQVVDKNLFYHAIVAAAIQSGRQVKVLERLSQPADHPVSIFHPEGEYLKGLVLEVQ